MALSKKASLENSETDSSAELAIVKPEKGVEVDGRMITRGQLEQMKDSAKRIEIFAKIMDTYGLDALIGLLAGGGDVAGAILSSYTMIEAIRHGMPKWKVAKMGMRLTVDVVIGLIPFLGDLADYFYKANKANSREFASFVEDVEGYFPAEVVHEAQEKGLVASGRNDVEEVLKA